MSEEAGFAGLPAGETFINRELSWLNFAGRVVAQAEREELPLLERVKFAGIAGMLHDEFFMKRMSGLKRQVARQSNKLSLDGRRPVDELAACREVVLEQGERLRRVVAEALRPALAEQKLPIRDWHQMRDDDRVALRLYFERSVLPILTPLTVDSEHPFPFISNLGINIAVIRSGAGGRDKFIRIKVPDNRPRWIPLQHEAGFVPLEQVIAANLDLLYPGAPPRSMHMFRVTRGAEGEPDRTTDLPEDDSSEPGNIIDLVSSELKARRFAGVVRLEFAPDAPKRLRKWLARQLDVAPQDIYPLPELPALNDLMQLPAESHDDLRHPPHEPVTHPRLRDLAADDVEGIFDEIARGEILVHHPYHSFDTSVLRFIESAAVDPSVLAIKLTIYRTSSDSPIVKALAEAARNGKQVAVMVEVTARFDEAPNIAWGKFLENEGVHVAYGVERLKTHVKLALVVREEDDGIRRYAHVGTGNYHTGTARIYEDLGLLTAEPTLCEDVAAVFNGLTGTTPQSKYARLLVAPGHMRERFVELIRREAEHARNGRRSGVDAKMNQLQDPKVIRELYAASQAGVPIRLNIRGLCCARPGVPRLSDTIQVFGVVDRFLEHSRIFRFTNNGDPEYYIGSADWMRRNLSNRVETAARITDPDLQAQLDRLLATYYEDNSSVWDCLPDGNYLPRTPEVGEKRLVAQEAFMRHAARAAGAGDSEAARDAVRSVLRRGPRPARRAAS